MVILAVGGAVGSLALALAGSPIWQVVSPSVAAGVLAVVATRLMTRRAPQGGSTVPPTEVMGVVEDQEVRRARYRAINGAMASLRAQVIYGLVGVTSLLVGAPAVLLSIGGVRTLALPVGLLFLFLLWLHWRSAWKLHRSIPEVVGINSRWPEGSLSPADRVFLKTLLVGAGLWYLLPMVLAALGQASEDLAVLTATMVTPAVPIVIVARRAWRANP